VAGKLNVMITMIAIMMMTMIGIVPDLGSRSRVVVFGGAGCWVNLRRALGIWNGERWEGVEKGEVSSRVTWD
jgi:hypothetical protein